MINIGNLTYKSNLLKLLKENSYIAPELYEKNNIKRGLRNSDGTGVLVGATRVASVEGYEIIDGKKTPTEGTLLYRGIPINDIVEGIEKDKRFGFEEVIFLLLFGQLPDKKNLNDFTNLINNSMHLPKFFLEDVILKVPSPNVMNLMQRVVLALYAYDDNPEDLSIENQLDEAISIISKIPLIMAYAYMSKKHYHDKESLILHRPLVDGSIAENVLHLTRANSEFTRTESELLDLCLMVHAEHGGGNNSAFSTHVVSSSGTDIYSSISTAIGSLKGPKHGGANFMVESMVADLKNTAGDWTKRKNVEKYLVDILNKNAFDKKGLIYGMGHAIYTKSDPRAVLLKKKLASVAKMQGIKEEFELLNNIEEISKDLFMEKKNIEICANVDLYSGLVYRSLGIDRDLYTPIFALARTAGWCAHRLEQVQDSKIIRPAYFNLVTGEKYIPLENR